MDILGYEKINMKRQMQMWCGFAERREVTWKENVWQ
jgi:hypothetical protein